MYIKILLNIIIIIILVAIQFSFISGLPWELNNFNLILIVLIFILSLGSLEMALWWALGSGLLLDIYSFSPFGVFLISLILATIVVSFLLTNFFTNRSLYSFFALTVLTSISYELILNLSNYFFKFFSPGKVLFFSSIDFWLSLLFQILLNSVAVVIVFYMINILSNRLKPAFLSKKIFK